MPSDTFSHTVTVSATPESIYSALQRPETWKGIGPIEDVWDATHEGDMLVGFKWSARAAGKSWEGTARRGTDRAAGEMTLNLDSSEIAGTIAVTLQPDEDSTALTIKLSVRSKGLLAGMFWGVVADTLRKGMPAQVEVFSKQF
ncbi:MAG: SRPBCC family protein [Acidimicrobiia bacterium]